MPRSRYRESRTLPRGLRRLPGESRTDFRAKIKRLREHFERFNVDVSELCQWMMGLRKQAAADDPASFGVLGDFLLDPAPDDAEVDETERDRWRMRVFDAVAFARPINHLGDRPLPRDLMAAIYQAAQAPRTPTTLHLFQRLERLDPAHRLVLLKAAAEWIVARYRRGMQNWVEHRSHWETEKQEWEAQHPDLTPETRQRFTNIFRQLVDDETGATGVRRKRPRICEYERLAQNLDNCVYAGEKGHGPLCWKYSRFRKSLIAPWPRKHFEANAKRYLQLRREFDRTSALARLYKHVPRCRPWFEQTWSAYLMALEFNEETVLQYGQLPHCLRIGECYERSQCRWNPHTHLCRRYRTAVDSLEPAVRALEGEYRKWRRDYLAAPRKPTLRYPSAKHLPMPKIFGNGFFEVDLEQHRVRLRLDDMPAGQWLELGVAPWPRSYRPGRQEVEVTSVHVHFIGARARAGLRFDVHHRSSRMTCSQDELDELRSRRFPRGAQDNEFLDAARELLIQSFPGNAERGLRLLAVDLGETGAGAAVYKGKHHEHDLPLKIVKVDRRYDAVPSAGQGTSQESGGKQQERSKLRGLNKFHVGRHLRQRSAVATEIAERRSQVPGANQTLNRSDARGLARHIRWMIRDWVRHNAAQVIAAAEQHRCDLIVLESQRGFLPPGYDQLSDAQKKLWLGVFSYGQIRRKITEKAVERGMRVVTLPYRASSQICSACGHRQANKGRWRKNKQDRQFKCECGGKGNQVDNAAHKPAMRQCGCRCELNSDANAARVLARVFWGEIELPTKPDDE